MTRAECIFALKCVTSNISFSANDGVEIMFQEMFPDSKIANSYAMASSKSSYVITHGIAPYVRSMIAKDACKTPFSFDETTTSQIKKQYDAYISYFSNTFEKVVTRYVGSCFSGHCTAEDLLSDFNETIQRISLDQKYLVQIGMDGPKVNTAFMDRLKSQLKNSCNEKVILDVGSCSLHKVNNAFLKSIVDVEFDFDGFASDVCFFFNISAARREDFKLMTLDTELKTQIMIRHSKIRWLSIGKVAQRIIDQWSNLKKYFLDYLPSCKVVKVLNTERYKSIKGILKSDESRACLLFVIYLCSLVEDFLKLFQSSEPLCHLLYPAIGDMLFKIFSNFVTLNELNTKNGQRKTTYDLGNLDLKKARLLAVEEINFGNDVRMELNDLAKGGKDISLLKTRFKKAYITLAQSLQNTLPFKSEILRYLQYLHPSLRNSPKALSSIRYLAEKMCKVLINTDEVQISVAKQSDKIEFEFKVFQTKTDIPSIEQRVDVFWHSVGKMKDLQGNLTFSNLSKFAKSILVLAVANAQPERGFSENKQILHGRELLSEETLEALRLTKNAINLHCVSTFLPMTKELLKSFSNAHTRLKESELARKELLEKQTKEKEIKDESLRKKTRSGEEKFRELR